MNIIFWFLVALLGFFSGYFAINYLTVHPLQMSFYLVLTLLCVFSLTVLIISRFDKLQLILAVVLALAFFIAGYYVQAGVVLSREDPRPIPEITRQKSDPGLGHTAVIYFTHGEPETYNPIGWLNQFREFDEQGIPFVPVFARPIFIYQLRQAYLKVGTSRHVQMHLQMAKQLEEVLHRKDFQNVKVYPSFLDADPRPDAAVIQAMNEGASQIVVAEVFVSISNHTREGEEQIESVHVEEYGIPLVLTGPLWDSETMYKMFREKADAALGDGDRSKTGVLLVGHGQPDEWDVMWPTETEHEVAFRQNILNKLVEGGYKKENVDLAWMEFKEPQPAEKVEQLLANGVEKILYFSAAISADSIHSQYDVPELMHEARVPEGFEMVNLGAWNDHPLTIQAIMEKVVAAINSF